MSQANVSSKARIGSNVKIGDFTVIHDNVEIGDDTIIESNCTIGYPCKYAEGKPLVIGANSHIRSHSIFYEGSTFGARLLTGHHAFARENCMVGKNLQLGTSAVLDGYSTIGDYVRLHSLVTIAEDAEIGNFVYILPRTQSLNDPFPPSMIRRGIKIGEMSVISAGCLLYPGAEIGVGCFVAGGSHVKLKIKNLSCVAGMPAKEFASLEKYIHPEFGPFHPWIKRMMTKYPEESHAEIERSIARIDRLMRESRG